MRIRLLAALLVPLLVAVPLRAQDPAISISTTYDASPRAVYRALIDVLEEQGFVVRARFLDAGVLTLPRLTKTPAADSLAAQLYIELEPKGDSTSISMQGRAVPMAERELRDDEQMSANAVVLQAQVEVSGKIGDAIKALPEHARNPDPREAGDEYGYGQGNPIRVGGGVEKGSENQRRYLDLLRGPQGQPVRWYRLGSCCQFRTPHSPQGAGMLDAYQVTYDGLPHPVLLFMDLYTPPEGTPPPPEGFTTASAAPSAGR